MTRPLTVAPSYRNGHFQTVLLAAVILVLAACASGGTGAGAGVGGPGIGVGAGAGVGVGVGAPSAGASPPSQPEPSVASQGGGEGKTGAAGPSLPAKARTADERKADIDKKMDAKLAEMDEALLKEKKTLAQERSAEMAAASTGGASAGGAEEGLSAGSGGANTSGEPGSAPVGEHNAESPVEAAEPADGEKGMDRIPPDIPDGRNDDVVARQLREAAMNEEDPVLREKLWDEYRKYKGGGR